MTWFLHVLGVDDVSGRWYGFWSGSGADLAYLGILWALVKRHNCHVRWCWRVARFPAGEYRVCRKHHPGGAPTSKTVRERYRLHLGQRPGRG